MMWDQLNIRIASIFTEGQSLIHRLIWEAGFLTDLGLFNGKMGVMIFFYECGKWCDNLVFTEFANELLDELWDDVDQNTQTCFATGLAGIGWGIEYLIQEGFVEATDNICEEIDHRIMEAQITDLSLETGLTGLFHYLLAHIKGSIQRNVTMAFDSNYLTNLYTIAKRIAGQTEEIALKDLLEKYILYYETKKEPDYNLDFTRFLADEQQRIGLRTILSSQVWGRENKNDKKKIFRNELFIFNDESIASGYGVGTYLREYLYCLEQIGFSVNLIELNSTQQTFNIQGDSIKHFCFPNSLHGTNKKYFQSVIRLLRLYIGNTQRLIFHLNYEYADFLVDELKLYFPNSKVITTVHYFYWSWMLKGDDKEYRQIMQLPTSKNVNLIRDYVFSKKFYDKVDHLIVLCEDTFSILHDIYLVPREKMSFIPNGMRHMEKELSIQEKLKIREKYQFSEDEKIILYVGRLQESKGILILIKAFQAVLKHTNKFRLVIVGAGGDCDLKELMKQYHDINKKVLFTGEISRQMLFGWYQVAEIGIIPSYSEQCSYVGIEMMMERLPVVTSDAYGVRNMFKEGENALIAKIGDRNDENEFIQNLTSRILELLWDDEKRERIAFNARKTYEDKYVIEKMRDGYLQLIDSLF
ncbi:glycosyltransferase [Parabacteroides goldsteinii]|uniref:glycosyltransferase n=1 Tax=Parabacteroides goldsteinii TaxID=328812 RepID=UPI00243145AC|nr:glycosyltransferase [Parabacteroides goldsteinii]